MLVSMKNYFDLKLFVYHVILVKCRKPVFYLYFLDFLFKDRMSILMYLRNTYILTVAFTQYFSKDGVWVGHLLSGYSLPMDTPSQVNGKTCGEVAGMWKHSIKVSYEATKAAFPGGEVIAHLDHK